MSAEKGWRLEVGIERNLAFGSNEIFEKSIGRVEQGELALEQLLLCVEQVEDRKEMPRFVSFPI